VYTLLPGQPIQIKDARQLDRLGAEISERLDSLEQLNAKLFDDIRIWWRQYEAIPRLKQKDFPFFGASNIVVPLIKTQVEAMVARTMDRVFAEGHRVWDSRTENEGHEDMARDMVRYMNWQADDNDFDFRSEMEDWLREFYVIGSPVFAGNWRELRGHVHLGRAGGKTQIAPIQYQRGPILEHVPRHLIQWDHSQTITETDLISRQYEFSFQQLVQRASGDAESWYKENLLAIRGQTGSTGPGEAVRADLAEMDSQKRDSFDRRGAGGPLDIREVHLRYPLHQLENLSPSDLRRTNGKAKKSDLDALEVELPIVATLHRMSRKVVRLVAAPYHIIGFPFFEGYYSKRPGRGHSAGAAKDLEQMQAGMTTVANQAIDAQTRDNSIWAKTKELRHLETPISPQVPILDPNDTFQPLQIHGVSFSNFNLLQFFQGVTERLTGQGDAQFGRETRMGGHPSPATSTMAMLQNSEVLLNPRHGQVSKVLSRAGMFLATVNQQFETNDDGRLTRLLGEIDGKRVEEFLFPTEPIPGNYLFSVKGLSRSLNSDARLNRSMQLFQLGDRYWAGMVAATRALAESLQMPLPEPIKQAQVSAYLQFMDARNETYKDLLQAADVDDWERFLFSVENFTGDSRDALQRFIGNEASGPQQPGGLAGASGASAVVPVAAAAGNPPFGAAGTTGMPT
jgi:hypothetical protein